MERPGGSVNAAAGVSDILVTSRGNQTHSYRGCSSKVAPSFAILSYAKRRLSPESPATPGDLGQYRHLVVVQQKPFGATTEIILSKAEGSWVTLTKPGHRFG